MEAPVLGKYFRGITSNVNQYLEQKMAPYGIGYGQFEYFIIIALNEGINQNDIAKYKYVGKASVTKAIRILEEKGFIKRIINEKDKRNYKLYCTDKGKSIIEGFNDYQKFVEATIFAGMSDDEINQFSKCLESVYKSSFKLITE